MEKQLLSTLTQTLYNYQFSSTFRMNPVNTKAMPAHKETFKLRVARASFLATLSNEVT